MKLLLKILSGLIALVLILVLGFAFTFNANDYKDNLITLVKEKTGRTLSVPGDISLSLFPWIGLELGKVELSNAKGFEKKPFIKIDHLQVRVKLLPLLRQQLEADTLKVKGLTLNLAKNKEGISNWADLVQENKTHTKAEKQKTDPANNPMKLLGVFALNGIEINQAQFNWYDQQLKQKMAVNDVELNIGKIKSGAIIPFHTQFHFEQKDLETTINLQSGIKFSPDFKLFTFHNTQLDSDTKLAALKKRLPATILSQLIHLDLHKETASSQNIKFISNDVILNTQFKAKNVLSQAIVNAKLNLETVNPRTLAKTFDIVLPPMSDKNALTKFRTEFDVEGSTNKLLLSNIAMQLDDTKITGKATLPFSAAPTVQMDVDAINIDRYLAEPVPIEKENEDTTNNNKNIDPALIPLALLTQVDVTAALKIQTLQIKKTHWRNVYFSAKAKQGNVQINPIKLQGYGSTINSSVNIIARKNTASLSSLLDVQNIKSGELLKDFMAVKNLQGLTSIKANINTTGLKLSQLKQNLNGTLQLALQEGIIKGISLDHEINKLKAKIKRQPEPAKPVPLQTKVTNLSASAIIKEGILINKDLRAATPFTRIIGQGRANLVKEQLDYIATVKLTSAQDIKNTIPFEKMKAVPLDVHIRGPFDKLSIKANFEKAINSLFKQENQKQQQRLKENINQQLKEKEARLKAQLQQKEKEAKEKAENDLKKKLEKKAGDKLKELFKF